jgi:hypothetical protein
MIVGKLTKYYYGLILPLEVLYSEEKKLWYIGTKLGGGATQKESVLFYGDYNQAMSDLKNGTFEFASNFGRPEAVRKIDLPLPATPLDFVGLDIEEQIKNIDPSATDPFFNDYYNWIDSMDEEDTSPV